MEKVKLTSEQRQNIYGLFSVTDHQQLLMTFILNNKPMNLFDAVKNGAVLTPEALWYLLEYGHCRQILKLVKEAKNRDVRVYDFLVAMLGQAEADKFVLENRLTDLFERFDNAFLVQNSEWRALAVRKEFVLLAENGQFDLLEEYGEWLLLAGYQQFDRIIKAEKWQALVLSRQGMELLIQYAKWEDFYSGCKFAGRNGFTKEEILETLWKHKQQSLLFEKQEDDFLLTEKRYFEPYKRNNYWASMISCGFTDQVDWELYLKSVPDFNREKVYDVAEKAKAWEFLARHKKRWVLLCNGWFRCWIKSFFIKAGE